MRTSFHSPFHDRFSQDIYLPFPQVIDRLVEKHSAIKFIRLSPEEVPQVAENLSVAMVPHFVFFVNGKKTDSVEGASAPKVVEMVNKLAASTIVEVRNNCLG
tara:strand:+ start:526 stop:831 length:306 start_codon:yes stop_codon:yes gene_type:complete